MAASESQSQPRATEASVSRADAVRSYQIQRARIEQRIADSEMTMFAPVLRAAAFPVFGLVGLLAVGALPIAVASICVATAMVVAASGARRICLRGVRRLRTLALRHGDARDRLVLDADIALLHCAWVRESHLPGDLVGYSDRRRATRLLHRALRGSIAAAADPELAPTARETLAQLESVASVMVKARLVPSRMHRQFLNALWEERRDPQVTEFLDRHLRQVLDARVGALRTALSTPDCPVRTEFALARASRRDRAATQGIRSLLWTERAETLENVFSPETIALAQRFNDGTYYEWRRAQLPRWLRGDRTVRRRQVRAARSVAQVGMAQLAVLHYAQHRGASGGSPGQDGVRSVLETADRVAEANAMRFGFGDRLVTRETLVIDARRVMQHARHCPSVPEATAALRHNDARMRALGLDDASVFAGPPVPRTSTTIADVAVGTDPQVRLRSFGRRVTAKRIDAIVNAVQQPAPARSVDPPLSR
ncbi:MAG: hypothetical protein ACOYN3_05445 [Acidimicrobiia bacterium]